MVILTTLLSKNTKTRLGKKSWLCSCSRLQFALSYERTI